MAMSSPTLKFVDYSKDLEEAYKDVSLEHLQEDRGICLQWIKDYEKAKADYQKKGDDAGVQSCDSYIQSLRQRLAAVEAAPEYKAHILTCVEKRDEFNLSMKEKCVPYNTLYGIMSGFTGSGKTHTLAMLTKQPPPSRRTSTAFSKVPTRTITQTRIGVVEKVNYQVISDKQYSERVLATAKENLVPLVSGTAFKIKSSIRQKFIKSSKPITDPLEREMLLGYHKTGGSVQSLAGHTIIEITDCGGQPQFVENLPKFISFIDFSIIVFNLSQRFSDYPTNYFYNWKGKSVGKGVPYSLTNEQIIRLHLLMIVTQSQGDRRVKFAFVGTHRDLEGTCTHKTEEGVCKLKVGECIEPRKVKNQRLKEMVEDFGLQDSVISKCHGEFIFAINAKNPEEVDHQTVHQLYSSILNKCTPHSISIPIRYHALELTIKRKVSESSQIAFSESAILKELSNYKFTEKSLKEGLRYLHEKKRIFYSEIEFPGRFIGDLQVIFNIQTELVVYYIQLSTNPDISEQLDDEQWEFVHYGYLTITCLEKFSAKYDVEGIFTPADMLKLFVKLLMISEVSDGKYLMPCVLPTDRSPDCNPEPNTQSVPPMVLHFPGGPARHGIFCGIICHLMTKSKWALQINPDTVDKPFHITRNSAHFTVPGYHGKVTINDPFDSFFVVTVHVSDKVSNYSETVCNLCIEVRNTLIQAIDEVTEKLNYSPGTPEVAFLCNEEHSRQDINLHPAEVSKIGNNLLCTKVRNAMSAGAPLTPGHRVWLRDSSSKEFPYLTTLHPMVFPSHRPHPVAPLFYNALPNYSELVDLQVGDERFIEQIGVHWEDLARNLEFGPSVIDIIKEDASGKNERTEKCCQDMFQRWLKGKAGKPVTWGKLVEALRDIRLGILAEQINKLLKH